MPRNIEIKAALADAAELAAVRERAEGLSGTPAELIEQDDSFFVLPAGRGRLKLRQFAQGHAELIHYQRADTAAAKASDYVRVPVAATEVAALREALSRGLGLLGRVRKRRWLVLIGATRVHLDEVEGLGTFMELEVVLRPDQHDAAGQAQGQAEAEALMQQLGLAGAPRLAGAYLDMLPAA